MPLQKSDTKIAEIWNQIRTLFLDELQNVPDSHHNSTFLQNLVMTYKPLNPHISLNVVFVALKILESLWGSENTHGISFNQIIDSDFNTTSRIEENRTHPGSSIYIKVFEEILNFALILPFNVISEAFTKCKSFNEFKIYIKKHNQTQHLQLKGRYYTPQLISNFIVDKTLKNIDLNENVRILDLCAGTGSFTVQICHTLYQIYTEDEIDLTSLERKKRIVKLHLRTIDVDPIATYILRIQVLFWYLDSDPSPSQTQEFLMYLLNATKIGNILEHPEIFKTKFNYIISNPPYISEKSNKRYIDLMVKRKNSNFYKPRLDYYLHFLAYAFDNIIPQGRLGFITPSYFLDTKSATSIREYLCNHTSQITYFDFQDQVLFTKAPGFHSCVIVCQMDSNSSQKDKKIIYHNQISNEIKTIPYSEAFLDYFDYMMKFLPRPDFSPLNTYTRVLGDIAEIRQGVVAGPDRLRKSHISVIEDAKIHHNQGVFVLSDDELNQLQLSTEEKKYLLPFSYVRDLKKSTYLASDSFCSNHHIIYLNQQVLDESSIPNILKYVNQFSPIMGARRENQMGKRKSYELHWPRKREIFTVPRILAIRRTSSPRFIYTEIPFVTDLSTNIIITKNSNNNKKLFEYLNSSEVTKWLTYYAKNKGNILQIDKSVLVRIPVPDTIS